MKNNLQLEGNLWLKYNKASNLGKEKIDLLRAIDKCGSLSKAAKEVGISYKTAWDSIDLINNLHKEILVEKSVGGVSGGGAKLTSKAKDIIRLFEIVDEEHNKFINRLGERMDNPLELLNFLSRIAMKTSARNQFYGKIKTVSKGAVNSQIVITLKGDQEIVSTITNRSVEDLGLKVGSPVYALIKASFVLLAVDSSLRTSSENLLSGKVFSISKGAVNDEIIVELNGGNKLTSVITSQATERLNLKEGEPVYAFFNASSVILAVE
ncbi:TOBE domain-containing protein [Leptospira barantonii]|uniref:Molybdenum-dependent transcriptional regulator n=1 Tax=Leptospira barantonii TaxID=2023184 RepID=A0ABX4NQD6_9LEPT|nr:TOBE domain-containing protein [Leptospira barantonii]PJZ58867.1 molybdenum-dependent transcriptional regulator [Leptospira barantonii]